jgi:hypothetical protein
MYAGQMKGRQKRPAEQKPERMTGRRRRTKDRGKANMAEQTAQTKGAVGKWTQHVCFSHTLLRNE